MISLMPDVTAEKGTKAARTCPAMSIARDVFPVPGGPQKMSDGISPCARAMRRILPSPRRCDWPTNSSRLRGRIRSAKGADFLAWWETGSCGNNSSVTDGTLETDGGDKIHASGELLRRQVASVSQMRKDVRDPERAVERVPFLAQAVRSPLLSI